MVQYTGVFSPQKKISGYYSVKTTEQSVLILAGLWLKGFPAMPELLISRDSF